MIRAAAAVPASLEGLAEALAAEGVGGGAAADGLVFGPGDDEPAAWEDVRAELAEGFRLTQEAVAAGAPVVYLISQPALLGRRGPVPGMLAGALASGVRALAMEGRRSSVRANGLVYDPEAGAASVARWARILLEPGGPSGDLIHLGDGHHGRVRP